MSAPENFMDPPEREFNLGQLIARGEEADRLLNGELAQEVRAELKLRVVESWANTDPDDVPRRELQYAVFHALDIFDGVLRDIINDGHHAAKVRDEREKRLEDLSE